MTKLNSHIAESTLDLDFSLIQRGARVQVASLNYKLAAQSASDSSAWVSLLEADVPAEQLTSTLVNIEIEPSYLTINPAYTQNRMILLTATTEENQVFKEKVLFELEALPTLS